MFVLITSVQQLTGGFSWYNRAGKLNKRHIVREEEEIVFICGQPDDGYGLNCVPPNSYDRSDVGGIPFPCMPINSSHKNP